MNNCVELKLGQENDTLTALSHAQKWIYMLSLTGHGPQLEGYHNRGDEF